MCGLEGTKSFDTINLTSIIYVIKLTHKLRTIKNYHRY